MTRRLRLSAALAPLALAACTATAGHDYAPPDMATPAAYAQAPAEAEADAPAPLADGAWWRGYGDPRLDALVAEALSTNLAIAAAEARLAEARALVDAAEAAGGPALDAGAEAGVERQLRGQRTRTQRRTEVSAEAGLLFSWVPDLFGGQRRAVEAAEAEARRQALLRDDLARRVAADVVRRHLEGARDRLRLDLINASLELQRQTLALVRERFAAGLASQLDVSRAEAQAAETRARRGPLRRDLAAARAALAALTGRPPGALETAATPALPDYRGPLGPGLPRDLLRRRPDVRAAEAALAAAVADIGVAEAELYPQLSLPGALTFGATGFGTGTVVETLVAGLAASLDIPLVDSGGRRAQVAAAEARAREALLTYRATLLDAVAEVETALAELDAARARRADLQAAVTASATATEQARQLYRQGLIGFLDVLDAERTLLDNRQDLAAAQADEALLAADLHAALGTGPDAPPAQ